MYKMSQTYEIWTPEDIEIGDTDERGWAIEDEEYNDLDELLDEVEDDANWLHWSSSPPDGLRDWVQSEPSVIDYGTGEQEVRSMFIKRIDGEALDEEELQYISDRLGLM